MGSNVWEPLADDQITPGRIWAVLGVLVERTKVIPTLVTTDQCKLKHAKEHERTVSQALNGELGDQAQVEARRFAMMLAVFSGLAGALFTAGAGALIYFIVG